jgi:hypothetical protein
MLLSIRKLIETLEDFIPDLFKKKWRIKKGAYGYGEYVCSIEDQLLLCEESMLVNQSLFSLLKSEKEYFYDACLEDVDKTIQIGIFDSTFLFCVTADLSLLQNIQPYFVDTKIIHHPTAT